MFAYLVMATGIAAIVHGLSDAAVRVPVDITSPAPAWSNVVSASPVWASLLAGGLALLLLIPVIRSTAQGHPFAPGNGGRWAAATAVTAIGSALATIGPEGLV